MGATFLVMFKGLKGRHAGAEPCEDARSALAWCQGRLSSDARRLSSCPRRPPVPCLQDASIVEEGKQPGYLLFSPLLTAAQWHAVESGASENGVLLAMQRAQVGLCGLGWAGARCCQKM